MIMHHVFIIPSPLADHPFIEVIKEVMVNESYEILLSLYPGHAALLIARYKEPVRFYSVGGDGMINQVMQAIVNTPHELAVIPHGTGNDFIKMLDLPSNPKEVLTTLVHRQAHQIDAVRINDRYYINSACFGIDALIANHVHDHINIPFVKSQHGYVVGIIRQIFGYRPYHLRLSSPEGVLYEGGIMLGAIMNGAYYGGGFMVAPTADLTDGLLEVVIIPEMKKRKILYPLYLLVRHRLSDYKKTLTFQGSVFDVEAVTCNLDGDEMDASSYHLEVIPKSIKVVF